MIDAPPDAARLAAIFLAARGGVADPHGGDRRPPGDAGEAPADLDDRLLALVHAGRAEHPRIPLDDARFVRHLALHAPEPGALDAWLGSICAGDLYLACACAAGVPAAIEALDRRYRSQVGSFLAGLRPAPDFVDDVAQAVRERLLVGSPPRIAEYSGRGQLEGWLRVVTMRLALASRRKRTEVLAGEDRDEPPSSVEDPPADPELDALKRHHADDVNAALRAAIDALTPDQRDLLRLHFVEGATLADIAARLRIGRATVTRRIAAAREEILESARRRLAEKLNLRPAELESLMGLMRSRIDLDLSSAFPTPPGAPLT